MFESKDNEFVAWYPACVTEDQAAGVWAPQRAAWYVHIPFCTAICDYCGFAVSKAKEGGIERYLAVLEAEIRRYAARGRLSNHRFECGHFGGGTPSVLEAADLLRIKALICDSFEVTDDAEITVEVNPISFTTEKALAYRDGGINRISFGLQTFDDRLLKVIGRPHRARDVETTIAAIHAAKFDNFSLDIIYGIPGQTEAELRADLARAAATGATHLSCFRLEIIPFTTLKLRETAGEIPERLPVETLDAMDLIVSEELTRHGYREYGAFNFAKPGYESVHNEIAFVAPQGEYVGFGNSAYSFINNHVYTNHAHLENYEAAVIAGRDPIAKAHRLTAYEAMSRYFVLGVKFLRVRRGPFVERFGIEPEELFGDVIRDLEEAGIWRREGDDWVITPRGRQYINNVAKAFYVGGSVGHRQHAEFVPTITPEQILRYARKVEAKANADAPQEQP
jgi:oxygen-independent coproporphyrinogen-3 oxidase